MDYRRVFGSWTQTSSRRWALSGLSSLALLTGSGAFAADSPDPKASVSLEEIVVTAQHREENIQTAPIVVDAISGSTLTNAGIQSATDLSRLIPSAQFAAAAGPFPILFVRGVGSNTGTSFTDSAVALSYDGVPLARPYQGLGEYYDLDRVEVLVGPQGTLYGRNATGGAINILPAHPKLNKESFDFGVDYGNYATLKLSGAANVPLSDDAALRVSFKTNRNDGYWSENAGAADNQAARVQLRWDPSDNVTTLTGVDYYHNGGTATDGVSVVGTTISNIPLSPGNVLTVSAPTVGASPNLGLSASDPRLASVFTSQGLKPPAPGTDNQDNSFVGVQSTINWSNDWGTLTVIPAYRHGYLKFLSYGSAFGLGQKERDDQESVEIRLASDDNTVLKWIVGGLYLHDFAKSRMVIDEFEPAFLGISVTNTFTIDTESVAPFADATYNISDTFRLLAGARYTIDNKTPTGTSVGTQSFVSLNGTPTHEWTALTYRAGLQWDVMQKSTLYATYSTGWHSGGFFFTHDSPIYQPETLAAITVGSKNRFFDDRLQANVELFSWHYKNQQTSFVAFDSAGTAEFVTQNVGRSTHQGADFDLQYQLTPHTTIGGQVEYLDATYQKFQFYVPAAFPPNTGCHVTYPGGSNVLVDCAGTRVPYSPKFTLNLALQQEIPFADGSGLTGILRTHSQTATGTGTQDTPIEFQKAYTTIDASLGFTAANNVWSLTAYGENITNEVVKTQTFQNPASGALGTHQAIYFSTLRTPATYGLRLAVHL